MTKKYSFIFKSIFKNIPSIIVDIIRVSFFFFFISKMKRGGTNDDNRSNYQDGQSYSFNKLD